MFQRIVFSDEITCFWDKKEFSHSKRYVAYVNGERHGETDKTHYTFTNVSPDTDYQIRMEGYCENELKEVKELCVHTLKAKRRIDVSLAPYNAIGDGETFNTQAIQQAINDCTENDYVYIPSGVFLTGALQLHDDMELYVEEGGVLQGSENPNDYLPKQWSRYEGIEGECYRSLLNFGNLNHKEGYTAKNLVLRGKGSIMGGGRELLIATMEMNGAPYYVTGPTNDFESKAWRSRGRLLEVRNAENIVITGLTLGMGSAWNLHFIYSKNIITYGCRIVSKKVNNGDGWDPDSSENCYIFHCIFDTSDDCIAIKSGKNPEGNIVNRPCKNIYVFDCKTLDGHGMSIGSEMSGGVENVRIWDSDFTKTYFGIQVKGTRKRGGYVKNLHVEDCETSAIMIWSVGYNDDGEGSKVPPVFADYHFKNVTAYGSSIFKYPDKPWYRLYIRLRGFEEKEYHIRNIEFEGLTIVGEDEKALETEYVDNVNFGDVIYKEKE